MNRQTILLATLMSWFVITQAAASAQTISAQAAEQARKAAAIQAQQQYLAAAARQLDAQAIDELARKTDAQARDLAALSSVASMYMTDQQAAEAQAKVVQLAQDARFLTAKTATEFSYDRGVQSLDAGKWQAAVDAFEQVIKAAGPKADGAAYWKAYAQNRLGQRTEALATLDELLKKSPNSRWASDAKALQVEVRQLVGQPVRPEQEADEELKLLAIRGLMNTDAERAVPMLEPLLRSSASPKMKDQALFVLGMSDSPKAREILVAVARGSSNPDMQLKAIKYLGGRNAEQNRPILVEIYKSTTDMDVKRWVIEALTGSGLGQFYYTLENVSFARNLETAQGLSFSTKERAAAAAAVQSDLWSLYQAESVLQLKKQILQALARAQSDKVLELARTEKNLELRQAAIQSLGMMKSAKTGDLLMSLYKDERDPSLKKAIVRGLYLQRNATALVQIARQETDLAVKKDVVEKLSTMKDKVATDYLIELLKK